MFHVFWDSLAVDVAKIMKYKDSAKIFKSIAVSEILKNFSVRLQDFFKLSSNNHERYILLGCPVF